MEYGIAPPVFFYVGVKTNAPTKVINEGQARQLLAYMLFSCRHYDEKILYRIKC